MASKSAGQKSTASAKPSPILIIIATLFILVLLAIFLFPDLLSKANVEDSNLISTAKSDRKSTSSTPLVKEINKNEWQVFTNEEYGYKVNYPKDWHVTTYPNLPNRTLFSDIPLPSTQSTDSEPILSEIEITVTTDRSIEEEISRLKLTHEFENFNESLVEVDGTSATKIEGNATAESYIKGNFFVRVYVNRGGRIYSLTYTSLDKKNLEIFNQMLSAFKFI